MSAEIIASMADEYDISPELAREILMEYSSKVDQTPGEEQPEEIEQERPPAREVDPWIKALIIWNVLTDPFWAVPAAARGVSQIGQAVAAGRAGYGASNVLRALAGRPLNLPTTPTPSTPTSIYGPRLVTPGQTGAPSTMTYTRPGTSFLRPSTQVPIRVAPGEIPPPPQGWTGPGGPPGGGLPGLPGVGTPPPQPLGLAFEQAPLWQPGVGWVAGSQAPLIGTGVGGTGLAASELAASGLVPVGGAEVGTALGGSALGGGLALGGLSLIPIGAGLYYQSQMEFNPYYPLLQDPTSIPYGVLTRAPGHVGESARRYGWG